MSGLDRKVPISCGCRAPTHGDSKVRNGAYLKVSYGEASVLACLSDDPGLDDETIRMDQTLRTAICLEKIMQGSAAKELVYSSDIDGALKHPVVIERSAFRGPTRLSRLVKQQYLICLVHAASNSTTMLHCR